MFLTEKGIQQCDVFKRGAEGSSEAEALSFPCECLSLLFFLLSAFMLWFTSNEGWDKHFRMFDGWRKMNAKIDPGKHLLQRKACCTMANAVRLCGPAVVFWLFWLFWSHSMTPWANWSSRFFSWDGMTMPLEIRFRRTSSSRYTPGVTHQNNSGQDWWSDWRHAANFWTHRRVLWEATFTTLKCSMLWYRPTIIFSNVTISQATTWNKSPWMTKSIASGLKKGWLWVRKPRKQHLVRLVTDAAHEWVSSGERLEMILGENNLSLCCCVDVLLI